MKINFIKLQNYRLINVPLKITKAKLFKAEKKDRGSMND